MQRRVNANQHPFVDTVNNVIANLHACKALQIDHELKALYGRLQEEQKDFFGEIQLTLNGKKIENTKQLNELIKQLDESNKYIKLLPN